MRSHAECPARPAPKDAPTLPYRADRLRSWIVGLPALLPRGRLTIPTRPPRFRLNSSKLRSWLFRKPRSTTIRTDGLDPHDALWVTCDSPVTSSIIDISLKLIGKALASHSLDPHQTLRPASTASERQFLTLSSFIALFHPQSLRFIQLYVFHTTTTIWYSRLICTPHSGYKPEIEANITQDYECGIDKSPIKGPRGLRTCALP